MKAWNLEETYSFVKATFGLAQERLARDSTRSVLDRQAFARYHYQEAQRLSKMFDRTHLKNISLINLHTQEGKRKQAAFERYIVKAGAHATAAVQSLHAIPDILAHAIYFACGQNLGSNALQEMDVALPAVVATLKGDIAFRRLGPILAKAQSGDLWPHLAAVSNLSKHRSVIRTTLNEDWTGTRKNFRELQFQSFERGRKYFPALSLQALIEPEYNRLSLLIVALGHELNSCLQQRTT